MTIAEGRGATRRLRRMSTETWWARLRQKIRALATWARLVRGTTAIWYVKGKGRGLTAVAETAEGNGTADGNDTTAEMEGRQRQLEGRRRGRAQTAMEGVKEGIRLWWWLEDGEGHNAKGPGSVSQAGDENEQPVHGGRLESARATTSIKSHSRFVSDEESAEKTVNNAMKQTARDRRGSGYIGTD